MDAEQAFKYIETCGLMAGLRGHFPPDTALRVAEVLSSEGINVFEMTMNSDRALEAMQAVKRAFGDDACVGMGTVLDVAQARQALEAGAVPAVQVDLAEALYRQGLGDEARALLELNKDAAYEPHRQLMVDYLLYRLSAGAPPAPDRIENGLPFWKESADRFAHTPYGQALADDVRQMQSLVEEA